jgi:hypothetical protein
VDRYADLAEDGAVCGGERAVGAGGFVGAGNFENYAGLMAQNGLRSSHTAISREFERRS